MTDDQKNDQQAGWGHYLGMGMEMVVGVVLGLVVGQWFDRRNGSGPWGVVVGLMIGLAGGMYLLIKQGIAANKDK